MIEGQTFYREKKDFGDKYLQMNRILGRKLRNKILGR